MKERPTKTINGVKIVGVVGPMIDGCLVWVGGKATRCVHIDDEEPCRCPFYGQSPNGFWLPEDQALPLLLTGDVK
jgi:hypothetical protein